MKKLICLITLLCSFLPVLHAEKSLDEVLKTVETAPAPLTGKELSEIAETTYFTLFTVPSRGLEASKADIEKLIEIWNKLFFRGAIPGKILALQIQNGINLTLCREFALSKGLVYKVSEQVKKASKNFDEKTFFTLFSKNHPDSLKMFDAVCAKNTDFMKFIEKEHWSKTDVLSGRKSTFDYFYDREDKNFPMREIVANWPVPLMPPKESYMQDYLILRTFFVIEKTRELSFWLSYYKKNKDRKGFDIKKITFKDLSNSMIVRLSKNHVEIHSGNGFTAHSLYEAFVKYIADKKDWSEKEMGFSEFQARLTFNFSPFIANITVFPKAVQKFISKANAAGEDFFAIGSWIKYVDNKNKVYEQ